MMYVVRTVHITTVCIWMCYERTAVAIEHTIPQYYVLYYVNVDVKLIQP